MEKYKTPQELIFGSLKNKKFAKRICIEDIAAGEVLNYGELNDETAKAAGILMGLGVNRGDTVSLLLENGLHFFMPWLGAMRLGAVANPINCLLPNNDILYALELCQTKLLVTQERYVWDDKKDEPSRLLRLIQEKFSELKILVMSDPQNFKIKQRQESKLYREKGAGYLGTYGWNVISQFCKPQYYVEHRELDDPFQLICTSGTTGRPKAVVQHCGMFEPNVSDIIKTYCLSGADRALLINRLFHVNAQITNFFPMALLGGTTVLGSADPAKFLETTASKNITYSSVIPPFLKYILEHPITPQITRKSLRFLVVGADILSPMLHKKFSDETKIPVHPGWGMTETMCWGTGTAVGDPNYWGSIGRAFSDFEVKIVDPENDWKELPANQLGRLIVKGPNVFKKYFRNEEATKKAFAPSEKWGEGWFDTGDTCRMTYKGGPLFFGWRASADSWKVRGEFVLGTEIDDYIKTHPAVDDAMAVPVNVGGETETVLCVVRSIFEEGDLIDDVEEERKSILSFCESGRSLGKLSKHYKIKDIMFVEKIELGDTGKKSRKKMAELAQKYLDAKLISV